MQYCKEALRSFLRGYKRSLSPFYCTLTCEMAPATCSCLQYCKEPLRSFFERFLEVFEPWTPEEPAASDSAAGHEVMQQAEVGCRAGHPSTILAAIVEAVERISTDFGRGRCKETLILAHSRACWLTGLNRISKPLRTHPCPASDLVLGCGVEILLKLRSSPCTCSEGLGISITRAA